MCGTGHNMLNMLPIKTPLFQQEASNLPLVKTPLCHLKSSNLPLVHNLLVSLTIKHTLIGDKQLYI